DEEEEEEEEEKKKKDPEADPDLDLDPKENEEVAPSDSSASTSRSSSTGRNSKRWIFLKDLLYRSKSEGRAKEKFWHSISFSPSKSKVDSKPPSIPISSDSKEREKPNEQRRRETGGGRCRQRTSGSSNRAQAEEMRKRTFLPYRQGLLGCLGFSSRGYGAVNGLAKTLNPVSSR
ncbi:DNA polymerase delta subunit 3-like, partial [Asparagus officinalis]|uniref:DNA polymerase delta subunit 3-like n=1 Tax=Asparagus officinalis TaxID=4686 RepID=UPI00098E12C9